MEVWIDGRGFTARDLAHALSEGQLHAAGFDQMASRTILDPGAEALPSLRALVPSSSGTGSCKLIEAANGQLLAISADASTEVGQQELVAAVGSVPWCHLQTPSSEQQPLGSQAGGWLMIPAENVIGAADRTGTKVAVSVSDAAQVQGVAFALQLGADALVLPPFSPQTASLWEAAAICSTQRAEAPAAQVALEVSTEDGTQLRLGTGVVTEVVAGGRADRVAVDFTSLLRVGEGTLCGSSIKGLALVHAGNSRATIGCLWSVFVHVAETIQSALVPTRPFRVNAGPVHSYLLMRDGSTKYLAEVSPGDRVTPSLGRAYI